MARVKFSGLISDISGSVGGSTFQKSIYGSTLRNKPLPIHKRTPSQEVIRGYLQQLHAAWRSLTSSQRVQWNQFINFSNQTIRRDSGVLLTGHDLFLKYNLAKLMIGDSILTVPTYVSMPEVPIEAGDIGVDPVAMGWELSGPYDENSVFFLLKLSTPRLSSRSFSPCGLRWIPCDYNGGAAIELYPAYPDIFGAVPPPDIYLHFTLQWFSRVSPIMNSPKSGTVITISY